MRYEILYAESGETDYTFYGGARNFARCLEPEVIVSGPAETGKTLAALYKLHIIACKYPGASLVIARKTLKSAYSTVLITFKNKVLHDGAPVEVYGGEKPEWFDYANGSRIWMAGLDKSSKVLSAEHDVIYVNQAEELTLEDWETLTTRTTGRAGNMPYAQTIGDMNPAYPQHWVYHRPSLRIFYSFHRENPVLYDQETGEITEQGKRTMVTLDALTGVRRLRLRDGKPAQAEGAIYDWDAGRHLVYEAPKCFRFVASVDWGYTNPGCIGVWGQDGDGRIYLVAQVYHSLRLLDWWVERARELQQEFDVQLFICDPSEPEHIERFNRDGLRAVAGFNKVVPGINAVQERLQVAGDGKPRLFVVRDGLRHPDETLKVRMKPYSAEQEFPGYVWSNSKSKEQPVKEDDHGMDMIRYGVAWFDGLGREAKKKAGSWRR